MRIMNIRSIDLNLLVILRQLLIDLHVSQAAEALNMSQPAVSRSLQKLRDTFSDPLLIRSGQRYVLSARAERMLPELERLLGQLESLVSEADFRAELAEDAVRFFGTDFVVSTYLSSFGKVLRKEAPSMHLEVINAPRHHQELLESGEVHFSIAGTEPSGVAEQFRRSFLSEVDYLCVLSKDHPFTKGRLTLKKYLSAAHGLVSLVGKGPGMVDKQLSKIGKKRQLALRLPNFNAAASFCEGSDLIFVMPEPMARKVISKHQLSTRPLPKEIELPPTRFYLYWHERYHLDPMCIWVRNQLLKHHREGPRADS